MLIRSGTDDVELVSRTQIDDETYEMVLKVRCYLESPNGKPACAKDFAEDSFDMTTGLFGRPRRICPFLCNSPELKLRPVYLGTRWHHCHWNMEPVIRRDSGFYRPVRTCPLWQDFCTGWNE